MKTVGVFEAKAKLSELCEYVRTKGESVLITKRGEPLVYIDPIEKKPNTIAERRAAYITKTERSDQQDSPDFEPAERSKDTPDSGLDI
ncbi:MAG: type II toxin-antitoxin system prevent-host-death family antitoxin [Verrucomicrobia bacterium]|nr:type II toxin-antitoxin system prevent-host-death family antitoxin [Verrucomicrobiota bacterium]